MIEHEPLADDIQGVVRVRDPKHYVSPKIEQLGTLNEQTLGQSPGSVTDSGFNAS